MVERHLQALERVHQHRSVDEIALAVTELVAPFNAQVLSGEGAALRSKGYLTALDDLPPWSVREACRRWLRHEAGEKQNYNFAPTPPVLRDIALRAALPLELQISRLRRLLDAEVVPERPAMTEEERGEMLKRLAVLFHEVASAAKPLALSPPRQPVTGRVRQDRGGPMPAPVTETIVVSDDLRRMLEPDAPVPLGDAAE